MLNTRLQRETSAKLADARAAGDDFRKGPTSEIVQLRQRVAQLEAQLSDSMVRRLDVAYKRSAHKRKAS